MNGNVYIISTGLIYLAVFLAQIFILHSASNVKEDENNIIKYPFAFTLIGIIGVIIFILMIVLAAVSGTIDNNYNAGPILCFCVFSFLGCTLILQGCNWKLIFTEDVLIYRNFWGITRKYSYADITRVRAFTKGKSKYVNHYKIYIRKKKITIDFMTKNFDRFEYLIKYRLSKADNKLKILYKPAKFY